MIELLGCPMHLGVSDAGLKKSIDHLNSLYTDLNIKKIEEIELPEQALSNLKNLNSIAATCELLAEATDKVIENGNIPLCIGGDHALAIGTVSGSAKRNHRLGLFWIDSHSDINTDSSTLTGNIHGMPVSAVMGFGNEQLVSIYGTEPKILPQNVVLFGVRDMDPPESQIIEKLGVRCYTWSEIVKRNLQVCLDEAKEYLCEIDKLHVSFDLDSMNPDIIKGVTVPVKDGFTPEDVNYIINDCLSRYKIASIDLVEYNPAYDEDGYTAKFTYSIIQQILKNQTL